MEEHEHRQLAFRPLWTYHADLQGLPVDSNSAALDLDAGYVHIHAGLCASEHGTGVFRRQGFQWFAATGFKGLEESLGGGFHTGATGGEGAVDGEREQAGGEGAGEFHGQAPGALGRVISSGWRRWSGAGS
ncbi:hypothetical protein D3C78_1495490 [compost metagenome]